MSRTILFRAVGLSVVCSCLSLIAAPAVAENWPLWRGAKMDGVSNETGLPVTFGPTEKLVWKLELPGPAGATPVVWGDRIFLTSVDGRDVVLMCVSTVGKELWKQKLASGNRSVMRDEGNSASPSPSTDGKHVWSFITNGDLSCHDFDGNKVWTFNVQERYGKFDIQYGMTSTPLLDGDRLYLQLIHGDGRPTSREALVIALDKATGKEIWKHSRASDARAECEHSYTSPVLYRDGEREFLLTHGADYIIAHSLKDGGELWRCGDMNPKGKYNPTLRFVASPVAVAGLVVVPTAKSGPVLGLRVDKTGDLTGNKEAYHWRLPNNTPDVPSPLVKDDLVYLCRENGNLICLDAKTGAVQYEKATHRDRHRASPLYADGRIYLTSRDGTVSVVKPGRKFELLATNKFSEDTAASPIVSGGRIYFRTAKALYAIGEK